MELLITVTFIFLGDKSESSSNISTSLRPVNLRYLVLPSMSTNKSASPSDVKHILLASTSISNFLSLLVSFLNTNSFSLQKQNKLCFIKLVGISANSFSIFNDNSLKNSS